MDALKIKYGEDTRRVTLNPKLTFAELSQLIRQCFQINDFNVKYEDDDKDLITISSDLELKEAIILTMKANQGSRVLRLFVSNKETQQKIPNITNSSSNIPIVTSNSNSITSIPQTVQSVQPIPSQQVETTGATERDITELGYGLGGIMQMLQNPMLLQMLQSPAIMQIFQNPALIHVLSNPQVAASLLNSFAQVGGQTTQTNSNGNAFPSLIPDFSSMTPSIDFGLLRNLMPNMNVTGNLNSSQTQTPSLTQPQPQQPQVQTQPMSTNPIANIGDMFKMITFLGPMVQTAMQNPAVQFAMNAIKAQQEQTQPNSTPQTTPTLTPTPQQPQQSLPQVQTNNNINKNVNTTSTNANVNTNTNNVVEIVHKGVICDSCRSTVKGMRFKCNDCLDYDLCQGCRGKPNVHDAAHTYTVHAKPVQFDFLNVNAKKKINKQGQTKRLARFVTDLTVTDGTVFSPNQQFVKVWKMRNEGDSAWSDDTHLVFVGGDKLSPIEAVSIPVVLPGQEIDISVDLTAPTKPGRYISYWRLSQSDGTRFGQRVWTDIIVATSNNQNNTININNNSNVNNNSISKDNVEVGKWGDKVKQLVDMGFNKCTPAEIEAILNKNGGDLMQTVQELLSK